MPRAKANFQPNQSNTTGDAHYTHKGTKGKGAGKNGTRAPHGYRFISVSDNNKSKVGQKNRDGELYKYGTGGTEGTHARVVSRKQQYRAIRQAFGMSGG